MSTNKSLLPTTAVVPIFEPLIGRRVGLIHSPTTGNLGDRMIEAATEQLLKTFGVEYAVQEPDAQTDAEVLVLFGGGSFGHPNCYLEAERRQRALNTAKPCVLLPQTAYGREPGRYTAVWVRDVESQRIVPGSAIAPDLAVLYQPTRELPEPTVERGEFFTTSPEGRWPGRGTDPRHQFADPEDYLAYVATHKEVTTDCLHAAVCGLIAGRKVTLCPTTLHKQKSIYQTWLRHLGCLWADEPAPSSEYEAKKAELVTRGVIRNVPSRGCGCGPKKRPV